MDRTEKVEMMQEVLDLDNDLSAWKKTLEAEFEADSESRRKELLALRCELDQLTEKLAAAPAEGLEETPLADSGLQFEATADLPAAYLEAKEALLDRLCTSLKEQIEQA